MSVIQDQASQITGDVAAATTQAQTAFENIRELTVSDYGKILRLYDLASNYLHWTDQHEIPSAAFTTLLTGANQLAWTGLMPTAFSASCSLGLLTSPNVQQFNQTLGFTASGSSISPAGRHWSTSAPSSLMSDISGPVSTDTSINGAMTPETFWEQSYMPQRESLSANALCPPFTGSVRRGTRSAVAAPVRAGHAARAARGADG
jgi:hypothetical protein